MEGGSNKQLSSEAARQLHEGISLVFSRWWALQMAVANQCGGPDSAKKAVDFASDIFNFFAHHNNKESMFSLSFSEPLYIDDLEYELDRGMDSFLTDVEDGSIEEIAEQLMIMHEECLEGNFESIQTLREESLKAAPVAHIRQVADDSSDEEAIDNENTENDVADMMVDSPKSMPNPEPVQSAKTGSGHQPGSEAEDGWVTVTSRKGRGKKH